MFSHLTTNLSPFNWMWSLRWLLTERSVQVRVRVLEVQLVRVEAGRLVREVEDMFWLDLGLGVEAVDGAVHCCGCNQWTNMTCWLCAGLSKTRQLSELNKDCNREMMGGWWGLHQTPSLGHSNYIIASAHTALVHNQYLPTPLIGSSLTLSTNRRRSLGPEPMGSRRIMRALRS